MSLSDNDRPTASRLLFLDIARCLAVALMLFAHVSDALVDPAAWRSGFGVAYLPLRGATAPLFLMVSGWAFALSALPRFAEHKRLGPQVKARLRRVGVLVLWGSLLTLPWWAEGFPFSVPLEVWQPFLTAGVLHCIAAALFGGLLLIRLAPSPRSFAALSAVAALVTVAGAPFVQRWAEHLPVAARGLLHAGSFSGGFPLLPWAGFFWAGSALGAIAWERRLSAGPLAALVAGCAVLSLGLGAILDVPCQHAFGDAPPAANPALAFHRFGITSLVLSGLATAARRLAVLPRFARELTTHALTFYVGHMLMLWGIPGVNGLAIRIGPTLSFAGCAAIAALCAACLGAGIVALRGLRRRLAPPRAVALREPLADRASSP